MARKYKAKYTGRVYNTRDAAALDNRNYLRAKRLAEQTNKIKPTYIGGSPNEARAEFWRQEPVMRHAVDSIAGRYGIQSDALRYRLNHEGFVDNAIALRNRAVQERPSDISKYRGYGLLHNSGMRKLSGPMSFGLDDVATLINENKVQPINEPWYHMTFTNEKGRNTLAADGEDVAANRGLSAATLRYFTNQAKRDYPNLSPDEAARYGIAYYNRGVAGGRGWAKSGAKGYDYKRSLKSAGKKVR